LAVSLSEDGPPSDPGVTALPTSEPTAARSYLRRYVDAFGPTALNGLRLGVLLHSAAGADLLVEILVGLGARCTPFGREDSFVAVDTEALEPAMRERAAAEIDAGR